MKQKRAHISAWSEQEVEEFHRLYALRSQVAGFAARQAAARVREGASAGALEEAYARMHTTAAATDYQAFLDADMLFHNTIAQMAGVPALLVIWKHLENEMKPFVAWAHRTLYRDLVPIANAHQMQLETIQRGEPDAAEHAAHVNLDSLWHMLAEQPTEPTDEPDPVERACAYVLLNLHQKISLSYVARDIAHLSVGHFNKLFRQSRGETFGIHVQNTRLRRAQVLLESGDHEIRDIALRVGYADTSRFGEHFKRRYGVAPSEYKNQATQTG